MGVTEYYGGVVGGGRAEGARNFFGGWKHQKLSFLAPQARFFSLKSSKYRLNFAPQNRPINCTLGKRSLVEQGGFIEDIH